MNKQQYEFTRNRLVVERKRLMDVLEAQEDFPNPLDIVAYEVNKKAIIDLDTRFSSQQTKSRKEL